MVTQHNGVWFSNLTGHSYDSEKAASHFDSLEARRRKTASAGDKVLESLTTEQLKALSFAMAVKEDQIQNRGYGEEQSRMFFEQHPELISSASAEGNANGASLRTWLAGQNRTYPYSVHDLENAYSALSDLGVLYVDESKRPRAVATEADNFVSPLDAFRLDNSRFRPA
jgi:hypothetical protein